MDVRQQHNNSVHCDARNVWCCPLRTFPLSDRPDTTIAVQSGRKATTHKHSTRDNLGPLLHNGPNEFTTPKLDLYSGVTSSLPHPSIAYKWYQQTEHCQITLSFIVPNFLFDRCHRTTVGQISTCCQHGFHSPTAREHFGNRRNSR